MSSDGCVCVCVNGSTQCTQPEGLFLRVYFQSVLGMFVFNTDMFFIVVQLNPTAKIKAKMKINSTLYS